MFFGHGHDESLWEIFSDLRTLELLVIGGFLLFIILARPLSRFANRMIVAETTYSPILLSYYTQGNGLEQMSEGLIDGVQYNLVMTSPLASIYGVPLTPPGALIYRLELPFHTQAHILGVSTAISRSAVAKFGPELASNAMERVELEGEFSKSFTIFAPKGQQMQTRYVFDPKAMDFTLKNCAGYHWEIVGDELYFIADPELTDHRTKGVVIAYAKKFIDEIRPALVSQLAGHNLPGRAPYGQHRSKHMCCPVCGEPMVMEKHWFTCPQKHGRLIGGQGLLAVRQGSIAPGTEQNTVVSRTNHLTCPNCSKPMSPTNYQSTGVIIDSCTACAYRWCDAGELSKIAM